MKKSIFSAVLVIALLVNSVIPVLGDTDKLYATEIAPQTAVSKLDGLKVMREGKTLSPSDMLATGDIIVKSGQEYIAVVKGDVNGDASINSTDFMQIRRAYLGLYNLSGEYAKAADVNGDTHINSTDFMQIRRHYLGIYKITSNGNVMFPSISECNHSLTLTAKRDATCTTDGNIDFWYCSKCDKVFGDAECTNELSLDDTVIKATGHNVVVDPAVLPTHTATGLTEGSHCSKCNTVLVEQTVLPALKTTEYAITYNITNNDSYLQSISIENSNPSVYTSEEGLTLKNLKVDGYIFEGWYDGEGANGELVKKIEIGTEGNIELYARWTLREYTVQFDSPDVPVEPVKYTVDKGVTLKSPSWFGYTFVGWSNDNGFIVSRIEPGTTGNITLHANWTSNRNKATSYANYGEPIIIEDDANGQFLFIYDIGRIDNVPISEIEYIGNSDGIEIDKEYEISNTFSKGYDEKIANTVASATTQSSGWTLSKEWNDIYEAGNETDETIGKTTTRTDSQGNVIGGNYFVSNSTGGSSYLSTNSGGSASSSSKVTTNTSKGINTSYDAATEMYADVKLGATNTTEASAGVSFPIKIVDVNAGIKNTTTLSAEAASGRKDNFAFHVDTSASSSVGTVDINNSNSYYNVTANESSTWNSTNGYEKSYQQSQNTQLSNAISEQISNKTSYNVTNSTSEANTSTVTVGGTEERSNEYTTTVKIANGDSTTKKQTIKYTSKEPGYYRLVNAGTVHVFGIVGYDVATSSYFTSTYSVLADEYRPYLDYSKENSLFNDCENAVVPFEIPFEVNEYIMAVTGRSEGLQFELDGSVNGYSSTEEDATVIIPQYYSADNGADTSSTPVKVEKFDKETFRNNTNIKTVVLPLYITEIPEYAFEGCVNLETVVAPGVTKIGAYAFKGCTALKTFLLDNYITELGDNAFEWVEELKAQVANVEVFDAAMNSGAKKITLNVSHLKGSLDNKKITVGENTEYFAFLSNGAAYTNLQIDSKATETYLSNFVLKNNNQTPLRINSAKLTLNRVTVENAPGFALILESENTDTALYDLVELKSAKSNAILCKNISLKKENVEVSGKINTVGDMLVCGKVVNSQFLDIKDENNNTYETITNEDFNKYLASRVVTFDANGGTVDEHLKTKVVYYDQEYGELPIPSRENYTFNGWFTQATGGECITKNSIYTQTEDIALYAQWTINSYKLTFDANGGTVAYNSVIVDSGYRYGTLPIPTRDYYDFTGWYTAKSGGIQVTDSTLMGKSDVTIYARWKLKEVSGWVLASEVPEDAEIVGTKWTYTLTETTESTSTSIDGWTQTGSYWQQTGTGATNYASFPTGFDTSHSIYKNFSKSAYAAYDNGNTKRVVSNSWAGYVYWHWMYSCPSAGTSTRAIYHKYGTGPDNGFFYQYFYAFTSTKGNYSSDKYYCNSQNITNYIVNDQYTSNAECGGATRWFRFDYYRSSYTDYQKIYQYKKVTDGLESDTEIIAGGSISNVQELVQYRLK